MLPKLLRIPHLELGLSFDLDQMRAEAASISEFHSYKTRHADPSVRELYSNSWSIASLTSADGDPYSDATENHIPRGSVKTPLADQCPYLHSIGTAWNGNRIRLMRIAPKGSLVYHSHVKDNGQPIDIVVIQVPIIVPEGFEYIVKARGTEYRKTYEPGKAYVFNCFHHHTVVNPSDEYRVTLMFYVDVKNPKFREVLGPAIEQYKGPLI